MPNNYVAPYLYNGLHVPLPAEGTFVVPVCTTRERFDKIMNALWWYGAHQEDFDFDHLIDWLDACSRIQPGCDYDPTENCRVVLPDNPLITWSPENPYSPGSEVPSGYPFHPWTIVDSSILSQIILDGFLGLQVGDIITDLTKIPVGTSWEDLLTTQYANFPGFRISGLEGRGVVKLHLLAVPQGGRAWVMVDDVIYINPLANLFVDLDRDFTSFPPETAVDITIEVTIEGAGAHHLDVIFLPTVNEAFVPIFFGGGFRYAELCGFELPIVDPCCPDENDLLVTIINNQNNSQAWWFMMFDDGTPDSFAPDAPENFDSNTGDTNPAARTNALCDAVRRYVYSVMRGLVNNYAAADTIGDILEQFPPFGIIVGMVDAAVDVLQSAVSGLANDTEAINDVICHMVSNLAGEPLSQTAFRDSVNPGSFGSTTNQFQIAVVVDINNAQAANYRAFASILGSEYERLANGGTSDCPCGCADDIVIEPFNNATIVQLTANTFQVTQTNIDSSDPGQPNARVATFRDILGRNFKLVDISESISDGSWRDCANVDHYTLGGIDGVEGNRMSLRMWSSDIDLIITVGCPESEECL